MRCSKPSSACCLLRVACCMLSAVGCITRSRHGDDRAVLEAVKPHARARTLAILCAFAAFVPLRAQPTYSLNPPHRVVLLAQHKRTNGKKTAHAVRCDHSSRMVCYGMVRYVLCCAKLNLCDRSVYLL